MSLRPHVLVVLTLVLAVSVPAQEGVGAPGCYIGHDPARLGGDLVIDFGNPSFGGAVTLLSVSGGYGPSNHPLLGNIWLDITDPLYTVVPYVMDATGNVNLTLPLPFNPALFGSAPIFGNAFTAAVAAPGYSLSKTVRIDFQTSDGFVAAGNTMSMGRVLHTATSLARDERDDQSKVLITGGGSGTIIIPQASTSVDFYNPMSRMFEPGPNMNLERAGHRAVLLDDGRVLVTGGVRAGGVVTATCEFYDPATNTFVPAPAMSAPRTAHAMTKLLDGRILVSGGMSTYVNAATNFAGVLNSSQNTCEIYDPVVGTWSLVPTVMAANRSGHTQTLLPNGDVMIIGGIRGGTFASVGFSNNQIPLHTSSVQLFSAVTNTFAVVDNLIRARAWHGASVLPTGDVLVTGGTAGTGSYGAAQADPTCEVFDGLNWSNANIQLTYSTCFHTQLTSRFNGDAIIFGGYTGDLTSLSGTANCIRHNGTTIFTTLPLGTHTLTSTSASPRGMHTTTRLYDGSFLVCGGSHAGVVRADGYTIVEE